MKKRSTIEVCSGRLLLHRHARVSLLALVTLSGLVQLAGCDTRHGIDRVIVEGEVTLDGEPVGNGQIYFYPTEENPGPVSGGPIKDGRYVAKARGGVPPGKHRVEITAYRPAKTAGGNIGEGLPADQYLPIQFNRRSELTAVVDGDSDTQTIDFHLKRT